MLTQVFTSHDHWLVVLAGVVCAAASVTTFALYSHLLARGSARHVAWLLLTGVCAGAGIWATHFVAMLAHDSGLPTRYDPVLTGASLLVAVACTTLGFGLSLQPERKMIAAGGAVVGLGSAAMHFVGVSAFIVAGSFQWSVTLIVLAILLGVVFTAGAVLAYRAQTGLRALLSGGALLTLGVFSLHFTAMAALTIVPAPWLPAPDSAMDGSILALAVAGVTALILLAGYVVALVDRLAMRETFVRMGELVDAAIEGLVLADRGLIVNVNSKVAELSGCKREALIGKMVFGDLLVGSRRVAPPGANVFFETSLLKADKTTLPVQAVRRFLHALAQGTEIYAIRDLRERNEGARQLAQAQQDLRRSEHDLRTRNLVLDGALGNMSQGLCMFDANQQVMLCNERYATIYGLPGNAIQPGMHLKEIIQKRIEQGIYAGPSPASYMADRLSPVLAVERKVHKLNNGQVIAIARQPLPGGGWVSTHDDITERQRIEAQITHLAQYDALTDLPSRASLRDRLEEALAMAVRHDRRVAVLILGIDRFNEINNMLGHATGDMLLKAVAQRLQSHTRRTTILGRFSDDKFVMAEIVEHPGRDSAALASRIQEEVHKPFTLDDSTLEIVTTIGIALSPADGTDADTLLKNADFALQRAKIGTRGSHRFFEPAMDRELRSRRTLEQDLAEALEKRQFELHYQPTVSLARNDVVGFEALLRWHHPTRGWMSPGSFLPLAEETGLLNAIEEWTLQEACTEAMRWPKHLTVAVNLSVTRFRSADFVRSVIRTLASTGLTADRLELDITEKVMHDNAEEAMKTLKQLADLGVLIALDDFGAGFTSLTYLRKFPFHKIKIDRSFISGLSEREDSRVIVRTLARLAAGLRIGTTAEGVETKEQLDMARAEGCTEMQGFYFSPPKTAEDIRRLFLTKPKDEAVA